MKKKNSYFLLLLTIFIIFLDIAVGTIYEIAYFSEESKKNDRLIHSVLGTNEDILICGSSRALHHYDPKVFEDSLKMTCYNIGSGGQNIYFHLALLRAALERYIPKIVILELLTIDFEKTPLQWDTEKLAELLPFVKRSGAARMAVLRRGSTEKFKLLSTIYPFNSLLYIIVRNNFFPVNNHYNGYIPLKKKWDKPVKKIESKTTTPTLDSGKINALFRFVDICQRNNIKLLIVISPTYAIQPESPYSTIIYRLKTEFNIDVLNFEQDALFIHYPEYFNDPFHLNSIGARVFSNLIVSKIKSENNKVCQ